MNMGVKYLLPRRFSHVRTEIKPLNVRIFFADSLAAQDGKFMDCFALLNACLENIRDVSFWDNQHVKRPCRKFVQNCKCKHILRKDGQIA